jgi:hypothetical protein
VVSAFRDKWPLFLRWLPVVSFALFMVGVLAGLTPITAQIHALGVQPLAALVLSVAYVGSTLHALLTRKPLATLQKRAKPQAA